MGITLSTIKLAHRFAEELLDGVTFTAIDRVTTTRSTSSFTPMDFNLEVSPRFTRLKAPPTFSNLAKKVWLIRSPLKPRTDTLQKEEERKGTALSLKTTRYNRRKQQHMVTER
ncbi:hypothetical protein V1477_015195, partial [Vespula maculifrons]